MHVFFVYFVIFFVLFCYFSVFGGLLYFSVLLISSYLFAVSSCLHHVLQQWVHGISHCRFSDNNSRPFLRKCVFKWPLVFSIGALLCVRVCVGGRGHVQSIITL